MMPSTATTAFQPQTPVSAAEDMEILLIDVGARSFGLPLAEVRYVASMPSGFAAYGASVADHFVFEGLPLGYVSLWDLLGFKSAYAEYEEMQSMLPLRRQDHIDWMAALEDSLRTGNEFGKARSPRECAFGKWFYAHQSKDRRLNLLLSQFEQPHATIHALADRLLDVCRGDRSEALTEFAQARETTLAKLLDLFDTAQRLVVELQRRIAIIATDGKNACAMGADSVRDIVTIPPDRIKPDIGKRTAGGLRATAGLIILEDQTVIPLLDWRAFLSQEVPSPRPELALDAAS